MVLKKKVRAGYCSVLCLFRYIRYEFDDVYSFSFRENSINLLGIHMGGLMCINYKLVNLDV